MNSIDYDTMNKLIMSGNSAYEYAWSNYEMLSQRKAAYVLYGPPTNYLGVLAAGHLTPAKERKVKKETRRKRYIQYELDENYHILRIRHMRDYDKTECTYHIFEQNGIVYGCPFYQDQKIRYPAKTVAVKYTGEKPEYFAMTSHNYLCVDYYEYPLPNRVKTTCYLYLPMSIYSAAGVRRSEDAPFGSTNSPVTIDQSEEEYNHIDFSLLCK